jgi:hypothetical protein
LVAISEERCFQNEAFYGRLYTKKIVDTYLMPCIPRILADIRSHLKL